jgi:N-acetylmuramoyl-L-alanine amidase
MPAVLIEVGMLSNAEQEASMGEDAFKESLAQAVAAAVLAYRDGAAAGEVR